MKYLIANWKSNKNSQEVEIWFSQMKKKFTENPAIKIDRLEIIICPPYPYLPQAAKLISKYQLHLKLGAQDVSSFPAGSYTGAVTAKMIAEYAAYTIIGHSERRKYFKEDETQLSAKVIMAKDEGLIPVYCIANKQNQIPEEVTIVAYEPVEAIGTGTAETPEKASEMAMAIKQNKDIKSVLYGGSVKPVNVNQYLKANGVDGVLVGGASLEAATFWEMIVNASSV